MKRLLCLVLTIVLAVCLTACGSEDESAKEGKNRVGKGKSTPTPSEVVTPSEVPTGEPETPTPVPTEEPKPEINVTPTPVADKMPVPDVKEGPNYVVAHGDGCDRYSEKFTGEGPAFDSEIDYLYITEYEYENLAKAVRAQNLYTYRQNFKVRDDAGAMFETVDGEFNERWYEINTIVVYRTDSKVFSYVRDDDTYIGGAHPYEYRTGYNFNSQTGERLELKALIKDCEGLADDAIEALEIMAEPEGFWDNWKELVRKAITDGTVGWVAIDVGIELWFNTGYLSLVNFN